MNALLTRPQLSRQFKEHGENLAVLALRPTQQSEEGDMQEFHFELCFRENRIPVGEAVTLQSLAEAHRLGYRLMRLTLATIDLPTGSWVLNVLGESGTPLLHIMLPHQRAVDRASKPTILNVEADSEGRDVATGNVGRGEGATEADSR